MGNNCPVVYEVEFSESHFIKICAHTGRLRLTFKLSPFLNILKRSSKSKLRVIPSRPIAPSSSVEQVSRLRCQCTNRIPGIIWDPETGGYNLNVEHLHYILEHFQSRMHGWAEWWSQGLYFSKGNFRACMDSKGIVVLAPYIDSFI